VERCNGHDDDCDGISDEDVDSDCQFEHAAGSCLGGACVLERCDDGFYNCNGSAHDGCESAVKDVECGECGRSCVTIPVADGGKQETDGAVREVMQPHDVDAGNEDDSDAGPACVRSDERCDDRDNDCDGKVDETAACSCYRIHITGQTPACDRCACDECSAAINGCTLNDSSGWNERCVGLMQCYGRSILAGDCDATRDCYLNGRGPCASEILAASVFNSRASCDEGPLASPCGAMVELRDSCVKQRCASVCQF
jgi:hypothetical protein